MLVNEDAMLYVVFGLTDMSWPVAWLWNQSRRPTVGHGNLKSFGQTGPFCPWDGRQVYRSSKPIDYVAQPGAIMD